MPTMRPRWASGASIAAAVTEFDKALAIWPNDPETLVKRGTSLAGQGRFDEAIASYRAATRASARRRHGLSQPRGCPGRPRGIRRGHRHVSQGPEHPARPRAGIVNLGAALLRQGKLDEAVTAFQEALRLEPWNVEAHTSLGAALAMQGKLDGAIAEYQEALREDPDHVPALLNLGIALAQSGRPGEAVTTLGKAVRLEPGNADAHHALGATLASLGRLDDAVAEFTEALRLNPGHAQAARLLAMARSQRGSELPGTGYR